MKIKIVDAAKMRNTMDTDFSGWGTHDDYPYIRKGEMWVDKYLEDEQDLFLALYELEQTMRGKAFRFIREKAKKTFTRPKSGKIIASKTVRKGRLTILYVDGGLVRKTLDPYFLLSGHDLVYSYIPKNQVWIDTKCDPMDYKYSLIHDLDERAHMAQGMSYANAHDFAIAAERMARRKDGVADFLRG